MFKNLKEVKNKNKEINDHWFHNWNNIFNIKTLSPLMNFQTGSGEPFQAFSFNDQLGISSKKYNIAKVNSDGSVMILGESCYNSEKEAWENLGKDLK